MIKATELYKIDFRNFSFVAVATFSTSDSYAADASTDTLFASLRYEFDISINAFRHSGNFYDSDIALKLTKVAENQDSNPFIVLLWLLLVSN